MNIFKKIRLELYRLIYKFLHCLEVRKYKKIYHDYKDDEYNCGSLKHIWGVKSRSDLSGKCNLYTMNDIDITYNRDTKRYILGVETIYQFNHREDECKYLRGLLEAFARFMDDNNYSKEYNNSLYAFGSTVNYTAETIEELYFNFKVFVEGYCKLCGY